MQPCLVVATRDLIGDDRLGRLLMPPADVADDDALGRQMPGIDESCLAQFIDALLDSATEDCEQKCQSNRAADESYPERPPSR
jgi:hypothetical protein